MSKHRGNMDGSDAMPNGNTQNDRFQTSLDVTNNRVSTLETSVRDLASSQAQLGIRLSAEINAVSNSLSAELKGLAGQFADRSKIPWPALGVMLAFITTVGGLVWYPVKDNQDRLQAVVLRIAENSVSKSDMEYRLTVSGQRRDDFQRQSEMRDRELDAKAEQIRDRIVPRSEHDEKWRSNDQRFVNVQRQMDEQKRAFDGVFSIRDGMQMMQKRLDAIEMMRQGVGRPP